jgi:deoxyribodipyrimidine photo-lyase
MISADRIHTPNNNSLKEGLVLYWLNRDQRVHDNWALLYAVEIARKRRVAAAVLFNLVPEFLGTTTRQYEFMLTGLEEISKELAKFSIPLIVLTGDPAIEIPKFVSKNKAGLLVKDFSPLKINRRWAEAVSSRIDIPVHEIDAHNIVPCRAVSEKQEYAAYTIRPKIHKNLDEYLVEFPKLKKQNIAWPFKVPPIDWKKLRKSLKIDESVPAVDWIKPGEKEARKALRHFTGERLPHYNDRRNDPVENYQSDLSPYLHFGQISAQRIALEVLKASADEVKKETFLEELIVRRELSDNFCFYNENYDNPDGFPDWAKKTLAEHRHDRRDYLYSREQLEAAETHDELWNAAQLELVKFGKMHGYMRMYWAKKILEWTATVEDAMDYAIYLNDRYELDGRDPNGYAGIAWSLGGVHDRAWSEREIFGKIRYMSYDGCRRKFDVAGYIRTTRNRK